MRSMEKLSGPASFSNQGSPRAQSNVSKRLWMAEFPGLRSLKGTLCTVP